MKYTFILMLICLMSACIPKNIKEKMNEGIAESHKLMADMEFQKAIAQVELHKLRTGHYPNSLSEIKFLTAFDSAMSNNVEYISHDSVYELNLTMRNISVGGNETGPVDLRYPPEFWTGLGCVKSNVK